MTTESEVEMNQHFSVGPTDSQQTILEAKKLLQESLEWVEKGCLQRDHFAFALKARIAKFIECA